MYAKRTWERDKENTIFSARLLKRLVEQKHELEITRNITSIKTVPYLAWSRAPKRVAGYIPLVLHKSGNGRIQLSVYRRES
jgi:hypothetical protein